MPSGAIITTLGLAKLASATPLNQLNISALAVGDGNGGYPTLDPSMTSLTNEVWRGTPSPPIRDQNSPNVLIFEAVIPPNVGGFTVREQAIFDYAGDMIAIGQTSVVEKPLPNDATGVILTVRLHIQLDNAGQVDLFFQDDPTISAGNVSNANGGSVQDFIDAQYTTVAELATGKFKVGQYVRLTDREGAKFNVVSGGTPNGYDIISAGNGNTAVLQTNGSVNIAEVGAITGGDASVYIEALIAMSDVHKIIIAGDYTYSKKVLLKSNLEIDGQMKGTLTMSPDLLDIALHGISVNDVSIHGLTMQTTQEAPIGGLQRFIQFDNGRRIQLYDLYLYRCKNQSITLNGCLYSTITRVNCNNSYGVAITLRNGCQLCSVSDIYCRENGILSESISGPFGRGLLLWESSQITVSNVNIFSSTEYGFRIYSQSDDTLDCKDITITNMIIRDSGKIDFYIYNESGLISDITASNINIKTSGTGKVAASLQGTRITFTNSTLVSEQPQQNTALALFALTNSKITNSIVSGFANLATFGSSSPCSKVTIEGVKVDGALRISSSVIGSGHKIKGCEFIFAASASQYALGLTDAETEISGNTFDGAFRCIDFSDSPVKLVNNKSINTKDVSVRKYGTSLEGMTIGGNSWDAVTNPSEFGRISEYGIHGDRSHAVIITNAIPSVYTYPLRSIAYCYSHAALSTHIGWTQTAAGVWKTFGAVSA